MSQPACPYCGTTEDGHVLHTDSDGSIKRRRRACGSCYRKYWTREQAEPVIGGIQPADYDDDDAPWLPFGSLRVVQ